MNKKHLPVIPAATSVQTIDRMLSTIRIPPRPSLLADVQQELGSPEPSPQKLSRIIGQDVAMAAALLKLANSSFIGLRLQANSVEQAVMRLGMDQCCLLLTGLLARQALQFEGLALNQFWDSSNKRAQAMSYYAKKMTLCRSDIAHTVGLFCNIGVPLMMARFPHYSATLEATQHADVSVTTLLEDQHFNTNHAALGALMARTWGLPADVVDAILLHHAYDVLQDGTSSTALRNLIALSLLVDYGIFHYHNQKKLLEWELGGERVCTYLGISQAEAEDISDHIQQMFDEA